MSKKKKHKKNNENAITIVLVIVGILVLGGIWFMLSGGEDQPGKYDAFAQCIADSGATFYGAYWCPHCQNQKKAFGDSADLLPYVECSLPGGQGQIALCDDAGIRSYPTWEFADGSRLTGDISHERLAEKTGCELPTEPME